MWADLVGLIGQFDLLSRRIFQLDLLYFLQFLYSKS